MDSNSRVLIAGAQGMVGSAIKRNLESKHYNEIYWIRRKNCDLRNRIQVDQYFQQAKPEYIFVAAAKVGGIVANRDYPADFIYDNLMIQSNIIHSSYLNNVKKLIFLGSSCIYPKLAKQPINENDGIYSYINKECRIQSESHTYDFRNADLLHEINDYI